MLRLVVLTLAFGGGPRFGGDPWLGSDKVKHFFTAAAVQTFGYGLLRAAGAEHGSAMGGAWALTAATSIGKEVRDVRAYGLFSLKDLTWDAAGATAAAAMLGHAER